MTDTNLEINRAANINSIIIPITEPISVVWVLRIPTEVGFLSNIPNIFIFTYLINSRCLLSKHS